MTGAQGSHVLVLPGGTCPDEEAAESSLRCRSRKARGRAAAVICWVWLAKVAAQFGPVADAVAADAAAIDARIGVVIPQPVHVVVAANPATH